MSTVANDSRRRIVAPQIGTATGTDNWFRLIPIWLVSATIMSAMLGVFFLIANLTQAAAPPPPPPKTEEVVVDTREESPPPEVDLTNSTLGKDSSLTPNRNIDNIDQFTAPGQVNPMEVPGILDGSMTIKRDIPPPPGTGGGTGKVMDTEIAGVGNPGGTLGGAGGIYNPGGVGGRTGSTKEKMLQEYGGNGLSEAAVADGLAWLALHQAPDGRWSLHKFPQHGRDKAGQAVGAAGCGCTGTTNRHNDTAATGLALLPFLGAGHTQRPLPPGPKQADYSKIVLTGLQYLMKIQNKEGYLGGDAEVNNMYGHAIATIALCEAYGMTNDPSLRPAAQKAVTFIVHAQSTDDPAKGGGGWRYVPKQAGDTSVTGWMIQALKSGQMAGLSVPAKTFTAADEYLEKCKSEFKSEATPDKKVVGWSYTPGSGPTRNMTAVALLCKEYMGVNPKNPDLLRGIEYLKELPPGSPNALYYEYYATQVFHHMGGTTWQFWNLGPDGSGKNGIRDTLIRRQDKGNDPKLAHQLGSWSPQGGGHVNDGGRIMWTSLSILMLEVYYRHLPLYGQDLGTMKDGPK
jgi:hypothetical protein